MKYLNALAWIIAIVTVAAAAAYRDEIAWAWKNRATIKQAADTAASLQEAGILK